MLRFHYCLSHMIFYITVLDLCQRLLSCMCFRSIGVALHVFQEHWSNKEKQQGEVAIEENSSQISTSGDWPFSLRLVPLPFTVRVYYRDQFR